MSAEAKVLIVGGTSGIGRAVANMLAAQGDLAVVAGRDPIRTRNVAEAIGGNSRGIVMDLTDLPSIERAAKELGTLDHLVLSAAALTYAPFTELRIEDAQAVFDNKFWGYFRAIQVFAPLLPTTGSITILSGVAADRPGVGSAAITSVNAALEGFARSLAVELAPIRVNTVSPGIVDTEGWTFSSPEERQADFVARGAALPVGRIGRPEDLAGTVLHLIDNGYATGANYHVDGGARLV